MQPATLALKKCESVGCDGAVFTTVLTPGNSVREKLYSAGMASRSLYTTPTVPVVGSTSTQGNHWSVALGSTSVGPLHDTPPLSEVIRNTSVFVTGVALSWVPLRLSEKTSRSLPFSVARGLATMFPAELTRSWRPVSVWRPRTLIG